VPETDIASGDWPGGSFDSYRDRPRKKTDEAALAKSNGRIAGPFGAAAKLGIPRETLESKIRSFGIDKHRYKTV
jgi:transcriptional regulator of acetoin/glycerol metabolism